MQYYHKNPLYSWFFSDFYMTISFDRLRLLALLKQLNFAAKPALTVATTTPLATADLLENLKPASVLVPLIDKGDHLEVLFTERAATLKNHAGHISFPGGSVEESDADLVTTALRETTEEIGLTKEKITLFGCLSPFISSSGYLVTPFVGLVTPPLELNIDAMEVNQVFTTPLDYVLDDINYRCEPITREGKQYEIYAVYYQTHRIWGLTAAILMELKNYLKTTDGKS